MAWLGVGTGLSGFQRPPTTLPVDQEITALVSLVLPVLAAGDTLQARPEYQVLVDTVSYATIAPGAQIVSVVPALADGITAQTSLLGGSTVQLTLTVTDSAGSIAFFYVPPTAVAAPLFSAQQTPAVTSLVAGQSLQDLPGFAAMTALGNFTSSAAPIASALVSVTGDAPALDAALLAGQNVGFLVRVTDVLGHSIDFDAGLAVVDSVPGWIIEDSTIFSAPPPAAPPEISGTVIS